MQGLSHSTASGDASSAQVRLIHRELAQLAILITAAVVGFLITRAIAASNHQMRLRDAAEWYRRGRDELVDGRTDAAIDSFRRATLKNRYDKRYVMALADALARNGQLEAARSALLVLRETAPEDREINLQLARLAGSRQDLTEAIRFYHNTLYAPWPLDAGESRRDVRLELVRLLLTQGQTNRALAELVALSADLPDDAAAHVSVGTLFATAGDHRRARDQFERALRLDRDNPAALAGAGQAAFETGDYPAALRFLRRAGDNPDAATTREVVELILATDPLASRIGPSARRQRLLTALEYANRRASACLAPSTGADATLETTRTALKGFAAQLHAPAGLEADTIEAGLDLLARTARTAADRCPPATPQDRALILIARLHGVEST